MMAHREYNKYLWYKKVFAYILYGSEALKGLNRNRQRLLATKRALRYRVANRVLYYLENTGEWAYCVLHKDMPQALKYAHKIHGHYSDSIKIKIKNLYGHFWWPSRHSDVVTHCIICTIYAQTGLRRPKELGTLKIVPLKIWSLVGMDFIGSITPPGPRGKSYILVAVDYFSRFSMGTPTENTGSQAVINWWDGAIMPIFGPSEKLYINNASGFSSSKIVEYFESHGSNVDHGPVYAPWTHRFVERFVQLIVKKLRKWAARGIRRTVEMAPTNWHIY